MGLPHAPPGWQRLSWHTDHMRRRAQGMRPTESGGMAEVDRISYARYIRDHYIAAGIEATPWTESPVQRSRFEYLVDNAGGRADEQCGRLGVIDTPPQEVPTVDMSVSPPHPTHSQRRCHPRGRKVEWVAAKK